MLYYYAKANVMVGHRFTDDVAVVRAISKSSAHKKLSRLYIGIRINEVQRVPFDRKVHVITDY